jgi:hypothetical protein
MKPTEPLEPVVLPYGIRRSGAALAVPLGGSEAFRFEAGVEYFPWRGFALTLFLVGLWSFAMKALDGPGLEWSWIPALLLGLVSCVAELVNRRDRLTATGIERRSGILGRRHRLIPYRAIELVKVESPGRGSRFDVGTVVLRTHEGQERLVAIVSPHEVARIIELRRKDPTSG